MLSALGSGWHWEPKDYRELTSFVMKGEEDMEVRPAINIEQVSQPQYY